jgi:hypothetical protein
MMRRVRDTLADLLREIVDRSRALREHIDYLGPSPACERASDLGKRVEKGFLGDSITHSASIHEVPVHPRSHLSVETITAPLSSNHLNT